MGNKKQKPEAIVTTTTTMDELVARGKAGIPEMLEVVKQKIKALTGDTSTSSSTAGVDFPGFGSIDSITKVSSLIKMRSAVINRYKCYKEQIDDLDDNITLTKYPFDLEGFSKDQWVNDIDVKIKKLANKAELAKLETVKQKLEENLSAEDKWRQDMQMIADTLTSETALE